MTFKTLLRSRGFSGNRPAIASSFMMAGALASTYAFAQKPSTPEAVLSGPAPTHGHSMLGDAFNDGPRQHAYLMKGMSNVSFAVTTKNPVVQKYFNQGLAQLHGFWYFEAERSFRQAASLDPDCATAFWGMAMANVNNASRAKAFILKADEKKSKVSTREGMWISALASYYQEDKIASVEKKKTYLKALETIQKAYPEDLEAKVFLCLQKWQFESEIPIKDRAEVDKIYGEVLAKNPLHPLHHYRIHLWNYNGDAKALNSAALSGTSSPGIAHMWHMQGHTYSALERYHDAAWSQEASARVDHAQMIRNHVMPDQIHNFAHNNQWLVEDLCYTGRATAALDLAKNMIELPRHPSYNMISGGHNGSASEGRKRLLQTLWDYELWDETILLSAANYLEPTDSPEQQLKRLHALGIAYFRKGDVVNSSEQMKFLEEMQRRGKYATSAGEKSLAESHKTSISQILTEFKCETALRDGKKQEALKLIDAMKDWLPKERASQLRFRAGDSAKAEELATASVKEKSGQIVPVANLVEVLYEIGKKNEAREKFKTLQALSGWIESEDMNRVPLYRRLSAISAELGMRADWRVPASSAKDIGPRPPLERLGPFRWHPSAAPDWNLADNSGKKLRLRDYAANGKPVIVIFYLGSGCQACMEQLNAFAPMTKQFDTAGISIVAIGVDPRKELKLTQDKSLSGGTFPFPVVSDKEMKVFKAYGAYDDFEKMPLHGAFLIDGKGLIRWQDIGFQPFTQTKFLLAEAKRLLQLPEIAATGLKEESATE